MSEPSAYICDHQSLIELNNTLEYCADSILKILEQVNEYLKGVRETMEAQKKVVEEALKEAEEKLKEAEESLNACEASQEWDEEEKEYRPDCSCEVNQVRLVREIRDKCQERLNEVQKIVDECNYEIEQYKEPGGILCIPPPGGEKTLENLAKEHTNNATNKMRDILDVVEKYLRYNMSKSRASTNIEEKLTKSTLTKEEKKERFETAIKRVIDRQENESRRYHNEIAEANRVMICPRCGRPFVACICSKKRELEYTRENIQIIKNDFSR